MEGFCPGHLALTRALRLHIDGGALHEELAPRGAAAGGAVAGVGEVAAVLCARA